MAEADNYWDAGRQEWIDGATGNHMKPVDVGGDGIWYSPDNSMRYVNGVWSPNPGYYGVNQSGGQTTQGATTPRSTTPTSGGSPGAGASGTTLGLNPGYQYDLAALNSSTSLELQDRQSRSSMELQQANQAFTAEQNRIANEFAAREAELNRQFQAQQNEAQRQLSLQLQSGQIDAEKYMQAKALAQQESEFARNLALQTLQADRDFQLRSAAEAREERLLRAQLAASPVDTVAYEFYKRGDGTPEAFNMAQQFAQGGAQAPASQQAGSGQFTPLSGTPYPADNPAYSDKTLQDLVAGFYNSGAQATYNPRLAGTGAFGVQIEGPQSISRAEGSRLTGDQMGVLTSFLKAGIDVGGGRRVSIDPTEYFSQVQNSWVPTLGEAATAGRTQYA